MSKTKLGTAWTDFGWQAIHFDVPKGWELGAVSGDFNAGYFRLDDEDMVRLEVKWEKSKGKLTIGKVVEKHLDEVSKEARKQGIRWSSKRNLKLAKLDGFDYEIFSFRGGVSTIGLVARCHTCERALFIRIFHRAGEPIRNVARRTFETLRCHAKDGKTHWHFYDFEFDIPEPLRLDKHSLKTGRLELLFKKKQTEMELVRISLASVVLGQKDLGTWFTDFYDKKLQGYRLKQRKGKVRGHGCLVYEGEPLFARRIRTLFSGRHKLYACTWRCDKSDKLYIFRTTSRSHEQEKLNRFVETINCH